MELFINKDSSGKPRPLKMRNLIVNNVQRYRLEINNRLVYAKGLIIFDMNRPVDGAGYLIDCSDYLSNIYAFYDDGFYSYSTVKESWVKKGDKLDDLDGIEPPSSKAAVFQGWYTTPGEDGRKINTVSDLRWGTSLFNYSANWKTVPQVTLYAHWKINEYSVFIGGVGIGTLSMRVDGEDVSSAYFRVPYNTDIVPYLNNKIGTPKLQINHYYLDGLDGTEFQQDLRKGKSFFLGWGQERNMTEGFLQEYHVKENLTLYPHFYPLLIWPRKYYETRTHEDGGWIHRWGYTGSGYWFHKPPVVEGTQSAVTCTYDGSYYWSWPYGVEPPIGSNQVIVFQIKRKET